MQYFGGKYRIAPYLAEVINGCGPFATYWEPFCGACSVMQHVDCSVRVASDIHVDLILLWKALQQGWEPPEFLSPEEYQSLRRSPPSALRGFAGFGCSHSGRWFAGYARGKKNRNYSKQARDSLLRDIKRLLGVEFRCCPYYDFGTGCILNKPLMVYCDPPYSASTNSYACGRLDTMRFWDWARKL